MSIAVGVWNTIVPSLTDRMSSHLLRAVINANVSCFMTACIAGIHIAIVKTPINDYIIALYRYNLQRHSILRYVCVNLQLTIPPVDCLVGRGISSGFKSCLMMISQTLKHQLSLPICDF